MGGVGSVHLDMDGWVNGRWWARGAVKEKKRSDRKDEQTGRRTLSLGSSPSGIFRIECN